MDPERDYYQISGYRAHSNGWFKQYDDKPMTQAIIATKSKLFRPGGESSPVELILGILPSGASYLLMTSEQMHAFTLKHDLAPPRKSWRAEDFLSLSPIYFNSLEELAAKIATYKQRPRNKNRRDHEELQDNSQANRGYVKAGADVVHYRGYFEHQRTLYRLLTRDLEPAKVGLMPPPWLGCVRVLSLVFEEWAVENRRRDDRLSDPRLVDVGWTEASFPSFFEQLTGSSTVHFKLTTGVINANSTEPYFSQVATGDLAVLYSQLRNLFSHDANKSGIPLIVLVHDEEMARGILTRAGIAIEAWPSGLSNLLALAPTRSRYKTEDTPNFPKTCFVDTKKLVKALMEFEPRDSDIPQSAKVLHMQTDTKTCAGDDSLLQLRMWTSMAQGLAIDEQRKQRSSHQPDCARVLAPPPKQQLTNAAVPVDPNDVDPNDQPPARRPTIEDDFSDDGDDW